MFDMKKNSGADVGYQIRITYNKEEDRYSLTGYIRRESLDGSYGIQNVLDGSPLYFNSLEEVLNNIRDYKG